MGERQEAGLQKDLGGGWFEVLAGVLRKGSTWREKMQEGGRIEESEICGWEQKSEGRAEEKCKPTAPKKEQFQLKEDQLQRQAAEAKEGGVPGNPGEQQVHKGVTQDGLQSNTLWER